MHIYKLSIMIFFSIFLTPDASFSQFLFKESSIEKGIEFVQFNGSLTKEYIIEAKGAGVAVADVNNDGWDDIYFMNGSSVDGNIPKPAPINKLGSSQESVQDFLTKG